MYQTLSPGGVIMPDDDETPAVVVQAGLATAEASVPAPAPDPEENED
jgi:hypothetical protein